MKNIFLTTALSTVMLASTAGAATFDFSQRGYLNGGVFSGSFEGEDLNNDGQLNHFDGEITDLTATFEGFGSDGAAISTSFDFSSLGEVPSGRTGLVLDLDGIGAIGDTLPSVLIDQEVFTPLFPEGIGLDNGDFTISTGPGFGPLCGGENPCGFVFESGGPLDILEPVFNEEFPEPILPGPAGEPLASTIEVLNITEGPIGDPEIFGSIATPFLPTEETGDNGEFIFEITDVQILPFRTFFFDPEIAVGYSYTITGSTFHSVTAPTVAQVNDANGQYLLEANGISQIIAAGETVIFGAGTDISDFTITGIDVTPGLDPTDPEAFITGVSVASFTGSLTIPQTPITEQTAVIPLPASFLFIGTGLAALGATRRRRRRTS